MIIKVIKRRVFNFINFNYFIYFIYFIYFLFILFIFYLFYLFFIYLFILLSYKTTFIQIGILLGEYIYIFIYLFIYLFYSLTSICDPMVDTLISYHRGDNFLRVGGNLFLRHTTDDTIGHSGGNE